MNVETMRWSEVSPTNSDDGPMKKSSAGMAAIKINNEDHLLVIGGWGSTDNNTPRQHNAQYTSDGRYVFTNEVHYYNLSIGK